MKHKRAFKKYLHGGAILSEDETKQAIKIQSFGTQLKSLSTRIATVSAKFANQQSIFSDYEQLALMSKQFYELFTDLLLGQLKYSMHLRETFFHRATQVSDAEVTLGQVRRVYDVAKTAVQTAVPIAATGAVYYTAGTTAAVGVVSSYALYKILKGTYYLVRSGIQSLKYYLEKYKRYFVQLTKSFVYTFFLPNTRRDMNTLYSAMEGAYKCQVKHADALENCDESLERMERYSEVVDNTDELSKELDNAQNACREASTTLGDAIANVTIQQGSGMSYIANEVKNALLLQEKTDAIVLDSVGYLQVYNQYIKNLREKRGGTTS